MEETWKDISGYEGYYQVSNLGRVRSLDRVLSFKANRRNRAYQRLLTGRVLYQHTDPHGYKTVSWSFENKHETKYVHRLVATAFVDNPRKLSDVNHIDGVKTNNYTGNLEWVTKQENMVHAFVHGLVGYNNPKNKKRVRLSLSDGFERVFESIECAARYIRISPSSVSRACSGEQAHAGGYKCEFI